MIDRKRVLRVVQWILVAAGLTLVGFWAAARLGGWFGARTEIRRFEKVRAESAAETAPVDSDRGIATELPVDTSLWAEKRIEEYRESLDHPFDSALAILRVSKIKLEVAVLSGTSELALNRGVGHIAGTPLPGESGNVGIAGHRDGYFRGLKDLVVGDLIEVETLAGRQNYTITELLIVDPPDVWVLEPTEIPSLTLVTCYPFYFVGSAPQRYIVRAEKNEP